MIEPNARNLNPPLLKAIVYPKITHIWKAAVESNSLLVPRKFGTLRNSRDYMARIRQELIDAGETVKILRYEIRVHTSTNLQNAVREFCTQLTRIQKCLVIYEMPFDDLISTFNLVYLDRVGDFSGQRDSTALNMQQKLTYCSLMSSLGVGEGLFNRVFKSQNNYAHLRHQMSRLCHGMVRISDATLENIVWGVNHDYKIIGTDLTPRITLHIPEVLPNLAPTDEIIMESESDSDPDNLFGSDDEAPAPIPAPATNSMAPRPPFSAVPRLPMVSTAPPAPLADPPTPVLTRQDMMRGRAQRVMMRDGGLRATLPEVTAMQAAAVSQLSTEEDIMEGDEEQEGIGNLPLLDDPVDEESSREDERLYEDILQHAKIKPYRGKLRACYISGGTFCTGFTKEEITGRISGRFGVNWRNRILAKTQQEVEVEAQMEELAG